MTKDPIRFIHLTSHFNLCPGRKALNKTISRFLLSMAIPLMSGVVCPLESNRTIIHLRGQRGPSGSVAPNQQRSCCTGRKALHEDNYSPCCLVTAQPFPGSRYRWPSKERIGLMDHSNWCWELLRLFQGWLTSWKVKRICM